MRCPAACSAVGARVGVTSGVGWAVRVVLCVVVRGVRSLHLYGLFFAHPSCFVLPSTTFPTPSQLRKRWRCSAERGREGNCHLQQLCGHRRVLQAICCEHPSPPPKMEPCCWFRPPQVRSLFLPPLLKKLSYEELFGYSTLFILIFL